MYWKTHHIYDVMPLYTSVKKYIHYYVRTLAQYSTNFTILKTRTWYSNYLCFSGLQLTFMSWLTVTFYQCTWQINHENCQPSNQNRTHFEEITLTVLLTHCLNSNAPPSWSLERSCTSSFYYSWLAAFITASNIGYSRTTDLMTRDLKC